MCSKGSLEAEVDALAAVDPCGLPVAGLQELIARATAAGRRLDGVLSRALGELQVRGSGQVPDPDLAGAALSTAAWLRHTAGCTGTAAGGQIRTSVALRELPTVAAAVVDGEITLAHARALAKLVGRIDPAALLACQPELLEVARRCDPNQLRDYVRHLIATWCEPVLEAEEESAEDRRFLQFHNKHNGSWRGIFELSDADMEPLLTVIETLARRAGNDDARSAGQRRADALGDIGRLAARHGDLPDAGRTRPRVSYVVSAAWAIRMPSPAQRALGTDALPSAGFVVDLDQHPGADCAAGPWTGPATRTQIETLLCDAQIERVVLDEHGQVISLTTLTDQITTGQRRAVAARDRCCVAKGCTKPPAFCDVHHLRARADGGTTDVGNLVLLCRRHHVMWHRQQLTITDLRVPWLLPQPRAPAPR
ncbi:MAG: hypothetical protein QOJ79_2475 [Actinomycetota bacterium]|jgi:hypothetical protein|nr:hypothetical protein [Actinomycetota bacterium]